MDRTKMRDLVDQVNLWAYHYYTLDEPIVSDAQYDAAYDALVLLEEETGQVLWDSPTQRVGGAVLEGFVQHDHIYPLYSLDKAQTPGQLADWVGRAQRAVDAYNEEADQKLPPLDYTIEHKFDGLTINLTYDQGRLQLATTRGNGVTGEVVTDQIKTIPSIPLTIPYRGLIEVQGEGVMPLSSLARYNKRAEVPLKNARNAAAGAIRNLNPKVTAQRGLSAYFYNVSGAEDLGLDSQEDIFDFLRAQHFKVHPFLAHAKGLEGLVEAVQEVDRVRKSLDVLTDGAVIKITDMETRAVLGYTNKFPRWAVAYKFEAEEQSTRLLSVEWNVGRTGKITPTAILEPVDFDGVTVSRATLNNWDDIQRKEVAIGAVVALRRSNDVIPEILGTLDHTGSVPIEKPAICPACETDLIHDGVHLFCPNSLSCPPQLAARMVHYASRNAMDIEGLSDKTVLKLMEARGLTAIHQIYALEDKDFEGIEGFGPKKTANLLGAIEASKQRSLARFIYAIGIPNVGEKTARDLAGVYLTLDDLRAAQEEDLVQIPDIGPIVAASIVEYFTDPHISKSLDILLASGLMLENERQEVDDVLAGKKIVVTGTIEGYNRKAIEAALETKGAKAQGSVSKQTDLVLAGEKAGSKRQRALDLGIQVLEGEDLYTFLKGLDLSS